MPGCSRARPSREPKMCCSGSQAGEIVADVTVQCSSIDALAAHSSAKGCELPYGDHVQDHMSSLPAQKGQNASDVPGALLALAGLKSAAAPVVIAADDRFVTACMHGPAELRRAAHAGVGAAVPGRRERQSARPRPEAVPHRRHGAHLPRRHQRRRVPSVPGALPWHCPRVPAGCGLL